MRIRGKEDELVLRNVLSKDRQRVLLQPFRAIHSDVRLLRVAFSRHPESQMLIYHPVKHPAILVRTSARDESPLGSLCLIFEVSLENGRKQEDMALITLDEHDRVVEPESKTREYKRDLSGPDSLVKTVIAFANSAGGELVIGVADDATVIGVEDPLSEEEKLSNLIADRVNPQILPTIELMTIAGKTLLVAKITLGSQRPYFLKKDGPHQGTYVRLGSSDRQANASVVDELLRQRQRIAFDQLPARGATLADLDIEELSSMLGRPVTQTTLKTLDLVTEDQGQLVPTNAGVVVACSHPRDFLPSAWVRCARFRGVKRIDIFDRVEIESFLPQAVSKVDEFLRKHSFLTAEFGHDVRRRDVWSVPLDVIRELMVNAIAHASYSEIGTPIRVAFFDDRIEVENPGGLLPGVTPASMITGISEIRNPAITRVLHEMNLMEAWGTGFPGILDKLAERGLPAPEIVELPASVRIIVSIPNHMPRIMPVPGTTRGAHADDAYSTVASDAVAAGHTDYATGDPVLLEDLRPSALTVLKLADQTPSSRSDLLAGIGLRDAHMNYERHLAPLLVKGLLRRTLPATPAARTQRYVTTDIGHQLLVSLTSG